MFLLPKSVADAALNAVAAETQSACRTAVVKMARAASDAVAVAANDAPSSGSWETAAGTLMCAVPAATITYSKLKLDMFNHNRG